MRLKTTGLLELNKVNNERIDESNWDPNLFLSEQFTIHRRALSMPPTEDFMEMSSGVNYLPVPSIWKESMHKEIDEDFMFRQYTSIEGFQAARYAVKVFEGFLFSQGDIFFGDGFDVCMTIGASQAADLALNYYDSIGKKRMLLVGLTYPLYVALAEEYKYEIGEVRSSMPNRDIPTVEELLISINRFNPDLMVFSYPSNPSGENYSAEEFDIIMQELNERDICCIFDCVCNVIISRGRAIAPEHFILKHNMMKKSVIVNSLSKTDSVPGFRIGYIVAGTEIIQFVRMKQVAIMNPPNIPTVAIWATMLFRCLFLCEKMNQLEKNATKILRYYKSIFLFSTIRCSHAIREYVRELVDFRIWDEYERYKNELILQEEVFDANKEYLLDQLKPFIQEKTDMSGGYNFLIKFKSKKSLCELDFCEEVLRETNIAIFTESAFSLKKANQENYWVRVSLAVPRKEFHSAVDRLRIYLSS